MQVNEGIESADNLIAGYLKSELTADEIKELISWIKISKANKRHFDEYCEIWITAKSSLKNPGYNVQEGFWKFRQKIKVSEELAAGIKETHLFRIIIRYAAVIIITFSLSGLLFNYIGKNRVLKYKVNTSELIVPKGSHAQFRLSDGTEVTLNAGSRLKYDNRFGIDERQVELEGEGYFKVAKDVNRPFIVKTSFLNVRALGTEFNVKAYIDDKTIETTLVEGSVTIESEIDKSKPEFLVLKPNQKVTFYKEDLKITAETSDKREKTGNNQEQQLQQKRSAEVHGLVLENVDVAPVISWKENRWIFEKKNLSDMATELERRFDIKIIIKSDRLKSFRFTGILLAEPVEQVLEVMSLTAPINFRLKGKVVTLYENKNFQVKNKVLMNKQ